MKSYIFIGAGGFLGAVSRYFIENLQLIGNNLNFPVNTLLINISGCFILALFLTLVSDTFKVSEHIKLGSAAGFLGAYTTFSTLCKDVFMLFNNSKCFEALLYILLSAVLGFAAAYSGFSVSKTISAVVTKKLQKR